MDIVSNEFLADDILYSQYSDDLYDAVIDDEAWAISCALNEKTLFYDIGDVEKTCENIYEIFGWVGKTYDGNPIDLEVQNLKIEQVAGFDNNWNERSQSLNDIMSSENYGRDAFLLDNSFEEFYTKASDLLKEGTIMLAEHKSSLTLSLAKQRNEGNVHFELSDGGRAIYPAAFIGDIAFISNLCCERFRKSTKIHAIRTAGSVGGAN